MPTETQAQESKPTGLAKDVRHRVVPADLTETTPPLGGAAYWALASPLLLFIAWLWIDLFTYYSPVPWYALNVLLAIAALALLVVLPVGVLAHCLVTSLPRLFHNAGWDVRPLEPVPFQEQHSVRYSYRRRFRAESNCLRWSMRAAQGWVYLEIAAIFAGALLMIPVFFSVTRFGFGR